MIRLRTRYDSTKLDIKEWWVVTDKPIFKSGKRSWRKDSYYLSSPHEWSSIHQFTHQSGGRNPPTIGATCLTVWSK
jgi:hypothetical protein